MHFSRSVDYAIRSLAYMAQKDASAHYSTVEIADAVQVSSSYLSKILKQLVKHGLLSSTTGPGKGYCFLVDPQKITILQIMELFNEEDRLEYCFFGWEECQSRNPCIFHNHYAKFKDELAKTIVTKNISDIYKRGQSNSKK